MRRTSVVLHGSNDAREENAAVDDGSDPAVVARTSLTFFSKNSAKFSAVWSVAPAT